MRISRDEVFLKIARTIAARSTCLRRSVGCVLTNSRGHILSVGYNGVAAGMPHCNEETKRIKGFGSVGIVEFGNSCYRGDKPFSGTNLDACQAIHAEQNALLQCHDVFDIDTCYCTVSPCITCTKLLMNTSCRRIVYSEDYPHNAAKDLWLKAGRRWLKI